MQQPRTMQVEGQKTTLDFAGLKFDVGHPIDRHFSHTPCIGIEFHKEFDNPMDEIKLMGVVRNYLRKSGIDTLSEAPNDAPERPKKYYVILPNRSRVATETPSEKLQEALTRLFTDVAAKVVKPGDDFSSALTQLEAHVNAMPEPGVARLSAVQQVAGSGSVAAPAKADSASPGWINSLLRTTVEGLPADLRSSINSDSFIQELLSAVKTTFPDLGAEVSRQQVIDGLTPAVQKFFPGEDNRGKVMYIVGGVTEALSQQLNISSGLKPPGC